MQEVYEALDLPSDALGASASFTCNHLDKARTQSGDGPDDSLVIVLPPADYDHADWRRALARDLARAHAPARVNVVAAAQGPGLDAMLAYLKGAKGVTGHYLEIHE